MHWIDGVADSLLKRGRRHLIASGISISGHIHIGHANDVFIADAVRRSLAERGVEARAIWYADDYDPMRRVPWPLNEGPKAEEYEEYLGFPYINIPSPDPKFKSFVDYFQRPFVESLRDFGIKVKVYSGADVYRSGRMAVLIRKALERSEDIRKILNRYRSQTLPEGWLPYDPICGKCGRISTAKAISWEGKVVRYRCEGTDYAKGCGHEGEADFTRGEGKLTWRVEWPARWKLLGVTCEPFGKDHAVVGGSYDTGKIISKNIFSHKPPHPIPYEWVSLRGRPMSSSHGIVFTLPQWLEVAEPELLRFLIFRSKPMKAKDFDPGLPLLDFYDEYDSAEGVRFNKVKVVKSRAAQISRVYDLSQVVRTPKRASQRVPFRFAAVLSQVARERGRAVEIMKKRKALKKPTKAEVDLAMRRLKLARAWVEKHAPVNLRFTILERLPEDVKAMLGAEQKEGLRKLARDLSRKEFTAIELHNHIHGVAGEVGLQPAKLFQAIYLALLGRKSGPRAGAFLTALDRDFVVKRFEDAAA